VVNAVTKFPGKISAKAKRLFAPREKFLVLEVTPRGANALFLSVDEDRHLVFEKYVRHADLKKFLKSPWRRVSQKSWEGNYIFKSHRKMIVSADPSLATTMPIPLDLLRERTLWETEITLEELENLIAQAMAKIFTQCRKEAAKRLGIDDIHAIMVGAKANRFHIDGHTIMNPIGFSGHKLSLLLELTFTTRDVFENFKQFFNSPDEFFFIEAPQAWLLAVARARKLPVNLITMGSENAENAAELFVLTKADGEHPVLYREKFGWSFNSVFTHIARELGVSEKTATSLYREYRAGKLSTAAERSFKKAIQSATDILLQETERAKLGGFVYIDSEHAAPFDFPHKHKGVTFEKLPAAEILAELDLTIDPESGADGLGELEMFHALAPFLEAYVAKSTSEINQKLRRRLHWLAD